MKGHDWLGLELVGINIIVITLNNYILMPYKVVIVVHVIITNNITRKATNKVYSNKKHKKYNNMIKNVDVRCLILGCLYSTTER